MNRLSFWMKNILRQTVIVFLIGLTFLGIQTFSYGNAMLVAQADTVKTPEGIYYKGTPDESEIRNNQQVDNNRNDIKRAANNIREKLNLDEPVPQSTKKFLKSTERKVERAVKPITGSPKGYYQETPSSR
jgi:hypothetical protein